MSLVKKKKLGKTCLGALGKGQTFDFLFTKSIGKRKKACKCKFRIEELF